MNAVRICFLLLALPVFASAQQKPPGYPKVGRYEKTINSNWTFNYFSSELADRGYESATLNDSRWPSVSLPHTWNTYETTGEKHPFMLNATEGDSPYWLNGWGWYRKHFSLKGETGARKVFLEFDGVQKYCKVYVNGRFIGEHMGGYGSFDFDVSAIVNFEGDNVIAVAVNNKQNDKNSIPPMAAGEFSVYGGIVRDVRIVLKDKLYIPMQGSAAHEGGTYITTPKVTEKEGIVRVQTWVKNDYPQKKNCILRTKILDKSGRLIQQLQTPADIESLKEYVFDQTFPPLKAPLLWSTGSPSLYTAVSELLTGTTVVDTYTTTFGFRWFEWNNKENSLYLNGSKVVIRGGSRQHEFPWLGDALPASVIMTDLNDIYTGLNYNFLRTSNYPNERRVYENADRLGIIICEELPNTGKNDFSPAVQKQQLTEMIRRDRNHPAVLFWCMGSKNAKTVSPELAQKEDTTRIIISSQPLTKPAGKFLSNGDESLIVADLSMGAVRGWHNNDKLTREQDISQGAVAEEDHVNMLVSRNKQGIGTISLLNYSDFGNAKSFMNAPLTHVVPVGLVDMYRIPKYLYYFWQANFSAKPMIFIQPHFWNIRNLGQTRDFVVYSNCSKVDLKINGTLKGSAVPDASNFHTVVFKNVAVEKGIIEVTGTMGTQSARSQVVMAGEPARIILRTVSQIDADKGSVAIVTADVTDAAGNHVYGATNTLRWNVSGPATLAGPRIYESDINRNGAKEGTGYTEVPVSNVIRSNGIPGLITVTVSSTGLASGSVELKAVEKAVDNSVISEAPLSDNGRQPVIRPTSATRTSPVPMELKYIQTDFVLPVQAKAALSKGIRDFIKSANQEADTTSAEFRELTSVLTGHMLNNGGKLSSDEFNFNADHYNSCRLITGFIVPTKLPQLFKDGLRRYYAVEIIKNGAAKNETDELNWINWIPSGGTVVVSPGKPGSVWPKGTIITDKTLLPDLITIVHPQFPGFSAEAKERALVFIAKMNPYVKVNRLSELNSDGKRVTIITYVVEKDQPVLIPLYKFIAE